MLRLDVAAHLLRSVEHDDFDECCFGFRHFLIGKFYLELAQLKYILRTEIIFTLMK